MKALKLCCFEKIQVLVFGGLTHWCVCWSSQIEEGRYPAQLLKMIAVGTQDSKYIRLVAGGISVRPCSAWMADKDEMRIDQVSYCVLPLEGQREKIYSAPAEYDFQV